MTVHLLPLAAVELYVIANAVACYAFNGDRLRQRQQRARAIDYTTKGVQR